MIYLLYTQLRRLSRSVLPELAVISNFSTQSILENRKDKKNNEAMGPDCQIEFCLLYIFEVIAHVFEMWAFGFFGKFDSEFYKMAAWTKTGDFCDADDSVIFKIRKMSESVWV